MRPSLILLVEDSADDVELTTLAMRQAGLDFPLVVARDGAQALEHLNGTDPEAALPAMVLLDLNLPVITGLEVIRKIRAEPRTRCIPVIVLTSSMHPLDIRRSYEAGANAYLRKPLELAAFSKVLKCLAEFWLEFNLRPDAEAPAGRPAPDPGPDRSP